MILTKSYKMMPILIGLTSNNLVNTEILFSESDIIKANYLESAKSSIMADYSLKLSSQEFLIFRFNELYKKWYENTMFYSSPKTIIEDENFQNILSFGESAIPLILEKIEMEPSQLVWALNIITQKKISQDSLLSISESCKKWVRYGKQNMI